MTKKRDEKPGGRRSDREQDEGQTTRGGAADQRGGRNGEPREKGGRR
jgi:hypothetical protein